MKKKEIILASALSGICIATNAQAHTPADNVTLEAEKCFGIQKKGQNTCTTSSAEIAAANAAFKDKYKKSTTFDCAGHVKDSDKNGHLGWVYVAKGTCLKIEGGFLIDTDKAGKKVVNKG
ncbi:DUF2282 domain-containing protein [Silvanigrella aquatica]|uniref:DUF2282 domain-containing protein n=1 Tax=Silvanigrella aquatica TaxID=1915309 RepID=A0A1L4D4M2_9BACT|nr:DUF2282 domain-containing protein [Silvanigrella aquatica]APJ05148.1 hypothetical protein AXG55_09490 [Silvanigrella aquatica]